MGSKLYFSEMRYKKNLSNFDNETKLYWNKILDSDSIQFIKETYGLSLDTILFAEIDKTDDTIIPEFTKMQQRFVSANYEETIFYHAEENKKMVFDKFILHFLKFAKTIFDEKIIGIQQLNPVKECFFKHLSERILKISVSTLIFEMFLLKEHGKLNGVTAKEEYEDYNMSFLGDFKYIAELLEIYPVLGRLLMEIIDNYSNNYLLLLKRLNADKRLLSEKFNVEEITEIENIESSGSDSHKKGNCVVIICWESGKRIVYKPHGLKTEIEFQNFQEYISQHCRLHIKPFKIVDQGKYGWEEFVSYKECQTYEEVQNYYYRIGMLIFCNYILNVNDIHTENLIAMGEHPIIIDSETIMSNKRSKSSKNAIEKVYEIMNDSVLNSGILPLYKYAQDGKGIDMSAINGKEGDKYPILVPMLKDTGLSTMHYEYDYPTRTKNNNYVAYNGKIQTPEYYIRFICEGFSDAYVFVLENRKEVLNYINRFRNLEVRHIVQDTQRYTMLLHTSYNPDFLQDGRDRQLFLSTIMKNAKKIQGELKVVQLEIKDLLNADIPYFSSNTSDKNLYGSNGETVINYFAETGFEHLNKKIGNMDKADLEIQLRYIKIVLTNLNDLNVEKIKGNMNPILNYRHIDNCSEVKMKAVLKLYNILQEEAVMGDNNEDVNWIGVKPIGEKDNSFWQVHPLGAYLYDGVGGIAIFYHALCKYKPTIELEKTCVAIDKAMFSYTNDMLERTEGLNLESSGAFAGEASIVYVYEILYVLTNRNEYLSYAKQHATILEYSINDDKNNDIIFGNAGAILVLINLYHLTGETKYLERANDAGKRLINNQGASGWNNRDGEVLSGFSHGISGVIYALSVLSSLKADMPYYNVIKKGLFFESEMYVEKYENWMDNRKEAQKQLDDNSKFMVAWCHGAPGILLARSKMYEQFSKKDEEIEKMIVCDIKKALMATEKYGFSNNDCLCHGNLGNTEILLEYAKIHKNYELQKKYIDAREKIAENILNDTYDSARQYLFGYKIQGFMTGISGMAYSLLRDIYPELPCVLSLEL